ncbi:hypothetical protein VTN96DRAFT_6893 [Rasamsonia emersonii]|uniref:RNA-binding La domain protein n=1 Tax=Rasamsonia emersonii (strain ATCC 16479 / CBS 393.64 / IMI 116815) TaxID=1408163 RepID=A0A0F4YYE1_RASE3|nr:RNA-binding La domain protein [Rasamsonia emersonii CBS 393.64]KKA23312.1 RNA-binding La domain protein [Rasamsonia emersonii CBS 393.64]
MSEEVKTASAGAGPNAEAEKDVQNVLAELKAEEQKAGESANGASADEAAEEARIVAEAAKLGKESEKKDESKTDSKSQKESRPKGRPDYRKNIKSDLTSQQESSDPVAIRKQVEFYFSDSNLPMDRFLLSKVGGSKNRPVDLTLIHSFKRMRHFQPFSAIVEALKSSETLELTDNDTKVRRKVPLPESVDENLDPNVIKVFEDKAMSRSIYAKGFGPEEPSTQFDIEAFFAAYGPTNAVRLRRTPDKIFKGSVFVEFDSEETQKKFLALDPKPKWKGQELIIKSKKEYCDEKVKEIEAGKIKPSKSYRGRGRGGRQNDDRDWRERRAEDQKKGFQNGGRDSQGNNKERKEIQKDARGVPVVQSTANDDSTASAGQKRAREEDGEQTTTNGATNEPPAKKVDVKEG